MELFLGEEEGNPVLFEFLAHGAEALVLHLRSVRGLLDFLLHRLYAVHCLIKLLEH